MTFVTERVDPRIAQADRLAASGDVAAARQLIEAVAASTPPELDLWRRLASLRRAAGELDGALAAIDAALALSPLDFLALLFRASLLDQRRDRAAGEAYGRALAQLPPGELPQAVQAAVVRASAAWQAHQGELEAVLAGALDRTGELTPPERRRLDRLVSNISRRTSAWHSEPTHFHYPGLAEREFHDPERFGWLAEWQAATDLIAGEFAALVEAQDAEPVPYVAYGAHAPLAQWVTLNNSRDWTALHLLNRGEQVAVNARHCPDTMALLARFPQARIAGCGANAMFSILAPHTRIPPHNGVANFRLVAHLPLIVPDGCWFRVGAETRPWRRGEAFVFDDCIEHEAANDSDHPRVVMILDCWHPDLSLAEREAISAVVARSAPVVGSL